MRGIPGLMNGKYRLLLGVLIYWVWEKRDKKKGKKRMEVEKEARKSSGQNRTTRSEGSTSRQTLL